MASRRPRLDVSRTAGECDNVRAPVKAGKAFGVPQGAMHEANANGVSSQSLGLRNAQ